MQVFKAQLKSLSQIMNENPMLRFNQRGQIVGDSRDGKRWTINTEMKPFFGKEDFYDFLSFNNEKRNYTHKGPGGWSYDRKWFVSESLPEMYRPVEMSKEVVTINPDILDIP